MIPGRLLAFFIYPTLNLIIRLRAAAVVELQKERRYRYRA